MEEAEISSDGMKNTDGNDDSQDSQEEQTDTVVNIRHFHIRLVFYNKNVFFFIFQGVSKWEKMEAEDKLGKPVIFLFPYSIHMFTWCLMDFGLSLIVYGWWALVNGGQSVIGHRLD